MTTSPTSPIFSKLKLRSAYGPYYRNVSNKLPRQAEPDEIPIIDISKIDESLEARQKIAQQIAHSAKNIGFFYIKGHGLEKVTAEAVEQSKIFYAQPDEVKQRAHKDKSKYFSGWSPLRTTQASPTEALDKREGFMWRYSPEHDPDTKDINAIPPAVKESLMSEDFMWKSTSHLPKFKEVSIDYWQQSLTLSRKLIRVIALSLGLPETYFDKYVTYPGADGAYNHYPALTAEEAERQKDVSLGSHTDVQVFTLLWQDATGGLQVLNPSGQWVKVEPIPDTIIVNIGDFLMRLSNDRYKSTVHRVSDTAGKERYSLSFFFGFNFNEKVEVISTCIPEGEKAKYDPISAGEFLSLVTEQVFAPKAKL